MSLPLGFTLTGLVAFVALTFVVCTTVNTFAMEAAVLFTPAFLFVYPRLVPAFPEVSPQAAIGLALFVELFGYSSSVAAYWLRGQIHLDVAKAVLLVSVPTAVVARTVSYLVPSDLLMALFGGMLVLLAGVLFQAHHRGASMVDWLAESRVGDALPVGHVRTEVTDGGTPVLAFDRFDRAVAGLGGVLAGLVGIAVGELSQTLLTVRKRLPVRLSTGTSALVLHGTILAALATNLLLLRYAPPALRGHEFTVPFGFGLVAGLTCVVGGQAGAYINSRVPEWLTVRAMMVAYTLVGASVVARLTLL